MDQRPLYFKYITSQSFLHLKKLNPLNLLSIQKDAFLLKKSARL
jgi:hypothetical protein